MKINIMADTAQEKAQDIFQRHLKQEGLRMTNQRALILSVFLKHEGHMTPEELYRLVLRKDRTIGQATVYRTLKLLKGSGIAREVEFGDGLLRYEHGFGHAHHDHLICVRCKKSIEALDPEIEALQERLAKKHGFRIKGHRMDIFGVCSECERGNKNES